ncbi:MAG: hypothetical protein JOZ49_00460 [Mycolicibacterium sp.]|nr:hypothetical protein [Mycolicibacterium sp.]
MDVIRDTVRVVSRTADATTAAAGALGGAAVGGVVGGARGVVGGIRRGVSDGSRSTPAAALTLAAIGAVGLVEWPVLLTVGGTVLAVHYLGQRSASDPARATAAPGSAPSAVQKLQAVGTDSGSSGRRAGSRSSTSRHSAGRAATARKAARPRSTRSSR